jgi:hypothetical protein
LIIVPCEVIVLSSDGDVLDNLVTVDSSQSVPGGIGALKIEQDTWGDVSSKCRNWGKCAEKQKEKKAQLSKGRR